MDYQMSFEEAVRVIREQLPLYCGDDVFNVRVEDMREEPCGRNDHENECGSAPVLVFTVSFIIESKLFPPSEPDRAIPFQTKELRKVIISRENGKIIGIESVPRPAMPPGGMSPYFQ
jgi:hypothetical protein